MSVESLLFRVERMNIIRMHRRIGFASVSRVTYWPNSEMTRIFSAALLGG